MTGLLLAACLAGAAAAEPTPASASLLLLPTDAGDAPVALRALADGRTVLVVAGRRGRLARFEGRGDAWSRTAEAPSAGPDEVAIDAGGTVWVRRGDALQRWDAGGLVSATLPDCAGCRPVHLRVDGRVAIEEEPTWTVPLADGLAVDVAVADPSAAPAGVARAARLHRVADTWALDVGGQDVPLDLDSGDGVAATASGDGWIALVGTQLHWFAAGREHEGVVADVAPGPGEVALRKDALGRPLLLAWDARVLRATTVDLDAPPIRWAEGWLPAGPALSWPRPSTAHDPLRVASQVQVVLPAGLVVADVAVTPTHLVVAGTAKTVEGSRAAVALVRR